MSQREMLLQLEHDIVEVLGLSLGYLLVSGALLFPSQRFEVDILLC
jgi:hypothetical protein